MEKPLILRSNELIRIEELLNIFPVTAILGPRQVGKTTLARLFNPDHSFDLENPRDLVQLEDPQLALEGLEGLIMIDEIQRKADLFPLLRYLVDKFPRQRYLILGSASSGLYQQSGESLAGRIGYHYLTGFNTREVGVENSQTLWLRGGFPRSFLAKDDRASSIWRNNFISTFLEKDLAILGSSIPAPTMYRFWTMLSHYHGQLLNYSELGRSFGISDKTIKFYISLLERAFVVRVLMPWHANVSKRLVKRPKIYVRDSGLFHSLQGIENIGQLKTHPKLGASWEGFALEEAMSVLRKRDAEVYFYRTHGGVEVDLFWISGGKNYGVEFKYKDAPVQTKSMIQAVRDLNLEKLWVVYPGDTSYQLSDFIQVLPLSQIEQLNSTSSP